MTAPRNGFLHFISIFLQVDEAGEVVRNSWEDCQSDCPIEEQNIGDPSAMGVYNKLLGLTPVWENSIDNEFKLFFDGKKCKE